jgi:hypothetical protein
MKLELKEMRVKGFDGTEILLLILFCFGVASIGYTILTGTFFQNWGWVYPVIFTFLPFWWCISHKKD